MRNDAGHARSFDRSSPVHAYWLARCEGFSVRSGRREGVVEEVELDLAQERAAALVVRYGPLRRSRLTPDAVDAVVPGEELLVVPAEEAPPSRIAPLARQATERAAASARAGARASDGAVSAFVRHTIRGAAAVWRATRQAQRWTSLTLWPAVRRRSRAAWRRTRVAWAAGADATRRASSAAWRLLRRLARWLAPRAAATARTAAAAARTAAGTAAASVAAAAAAVVRAVRVYGPPARRAVARRASGIAAQLRSRPVAPGPDEARGDISGRRRSRPARPVSRSDGRVAPHEQRQSEDRHRGGRAGQLHRDAADPNDVDKGEHAPAERKRAGRQA
jgi:hypothetical protein